MNRSCTASLRVTCCRRATSFRLTSAQPWMASVVRDYVGHGIGRRMHEDPQIPNYGKPGKGPKIKKGYVFAVEPMLNMGSYYTKTLKDGWTVVTVDGLPSAHAEHTI